MIVQKDEKKRLIKDARKYISDHQSDFIKIYGLPDFIISDLIKKTSIYTYKPDETHLRSINSKVEDLSVKDLEYFSLDRFTIYLRDYIINSNNKIDVFIHENKLHLFYPFLINESDRIMIVFERKGTIFDNIARKGKTASL